MKALIKIAFSILAITISLYSISAQEMELSDIQLQQKVVATDDIPMDAWTFKNLVGNEELSNHFEKFTKSRFDKKVKKVQKNIWVANEIFDEQISPKRADVKLVVLKEQNQVALIFIMGYDYWANSIDFPAEMDAFRSFVIDFQEFHYQQDYLERIDEINKTLKKNQRQFNGLVSENSNLNNRISNAEGKIEDLKGRKKSKAELKLAQDRSRVLQINKEMAELSPSISKAQNEVNTLNSQLLSLETTFENLRTQYQSGSHH